MGAPYLSDLITDVKIIPIRNSTTKTVAFANVTIAGHLVLKDMRIVEGREGLFVAMPQKKVTDRDGKENYYDIYNPITKEGREDLTKAVLEAYEREVNGSRRDSGRSSSRDDRDDRSGRTREAASSSARTSSRSSRDYSDDDVPF